MIANSSRSFVLYFASALFWKFWHKRNWGTNISLDFLFKVRLQTDVTCFAVTSRFFGCIVTKKMWDFELGLITPVAA